VPFTLIRIMPLLLACSFVAVYGLIALALPTVIEATEPYYDTFTSIRWAMLQPHYLKLILAYLFNPFLRIAGDSLIRVGEPPVYVSSWEIIPIGIYFWVMFKVLSVCIADWARASEEAIKNLSEIVIVFAEQHCQGFWDWTINGVYRSLTWTQIVAPLTKFLLVHLIAVLAISALSALVQLNLSALIFFLLALGFLTLVGSYFSGLSFPFVNFIKMVHASRHDLLRHANKIKTEREFNEYIRNPHQFRLKEKTK